MEKQQVKEQFSIKIYETADAPEPVYSGIVSGRDELKLVTWALKPEAVVRFCPITGESAREIVGKLLNLSDARTLKALNWDFPDRRKETH
jgi:hypothetical protein